MKGQEIALQSKKYITIALLQLMEKNPYEGITIKDITDQAGVARLTFYRNFTNKDDVLKKTFAKYVYSLYERIRK